MTAVTIRSMEPEEDGILVRAAVENFNWREHRFSTADVLASPQMGRYTEFIPTRGDFAFLAILDEAIVGVVWAQYFPRSAGTWGFVAPSIPEISVWVEAPHRRSGIGRVLIHAVQHVARMRDLPGLSLSVDNDNPARRLYLSEGFTDVAGRERDGVMLWQTDDGQVAS